jgi:hypothetical protein
MIRFYFFVFIRVSWCYTDTTLKACPSVIPVVYRY